MKLRSEPLDDIRNELPGRYRSHSHNRPQAFQRHRSPHPGGSHQQRPARVINAALEVLSRQQVDASRVAEELRA